MESMLLELAKEAPLVAAVIGVLVWSHRREMRSVRAELRRLGRIILRCHGRPATELEQLGEPDEAESDTAKREHARADDDTTRLQVQARSK